LFVSCTGFMLLCIILFWIESSIIFSHKTYLPLVAVGLFVAVTMLTSGLLLIRGGILEK
jgi:hypothetical protein